MVTFTTTNDLFYVSHFFDLSEEDYVFLYNKPKRERSTYSLKNMPCPTAPRKALRPPPIVDNEPEEPTPMDWEPSYATKVETHKRERCESQDEGRTNTAKRTRFNPPAGIVQGPRSTITIPIVDTKPKRERLTYSPKNMPCPTAPRKAIRPPILLRTNLKNLLPSCFKASLGLLPLLLLLLQLKTFTIWRRLRIWRRLEPPLVENAPAEELSPRMLDFEPYANLTDHDPTIHIDVDIEVEVEPTFPVEDYVTLEGAPSTTFLRSPNQRSKGRVPPPRRSIRLATKTNLGSIYAPSGRRRSARVLARI